MIKFRGVALTLILTILSLVWTGTLSTANADPRPAPPPGEVVILDDSDCGSIFDVWSDRNRKKFIAYYGSDPPERHQRRSHAAHVRQ